MPYFLLAAALVVLDQLVKLLVLRFLPLGGRVPLIPHLVELTYVQNTGAAFSLFSRHTWVLAAVSLAVSLVLAAALWKGFFRHPLGKLALSLLLAGAVGNLIDRDTSGLIIAAKNDRAHLALAAQLQDHTLARVYEAVTVGGLKEDSGTVNAPIGRHPVDRKRMAVDRLHGRPAVTHWRVLERFSGYTHVECRLETGRTHQIRVHMASLGHPLLGDVVYGSKKPWPGLAGQCLHARRLTFVHPATGLPMTLECPLPEWFEKVLESLARRS